MAATLDAGAGAAENVNAVAVELVARQCARLLEDKRKRTFSVDEFSASELLAMFLQLPNMSAAQFAEFRRALAACGETMPEYPDEVARIAHSAADMDRLATVIHDAKLADARDLVIPLDEQAAEPLPPDTKQPPLLPGHARTAAQAQAAAGSSEDKSLRSSYRKLLRLFAQQRDRTGRGSDRRDRIAMQEERARIQVLKRQQEIVQREQVAQLMAPKPGEKQSQAS